MKIVTSTLFTLVLAAVPSVWAAGGSNSTSHPSSSSPTLPTIPTFAPDIDLTPFVDDDDFDLSALTQRRNLTRGDGHGDRVGSGDLAVIPKGYNTWSNLTFGDDTSPRLQNGSCITTFGNNTWADIDRLYSNIEQAAIQIAPGARVSTGDLAVIANATLEIAFAGDGARCGTNRSLSLNGSLVIRGSATDDDVARGISGGRFDFPVDARNNTIGVNAIANVSGGVELTGDLGTLKLSVNASGAASASCKVPRNGSLHTSADVLGAGGEVTVYGSLNFTGKTFQPKLSIPQGGNVTIDVGRYGNFTGGHLNLTPGGRVELRSRGNGTFFANLTFEWNSTLRIRVDSIASLRNRSIVLFNYSSLDSVYRSNFHGSVEIFDDNQTLPLINPNNVQASRRLLADDGTVTWTDNGAYASVPDFGNGTAIPNAGGSNNGTTHPTSSSPTFPTFPTFAPDLDLTPFLTDDFDPSAFTQRRNLTRGDGHGDRVGSGDLAVIPKGYNTWSNLTFGDDTDPRLQNGSCITTFGNNTWADIDRLYSNIEQAAIQIAPGARVSTGDLAVIANATLEIAFAGDGARCGTNRSLSFNGSLVIRGSATDDDVARGISGGRFDFPVDARNYTIGSKAIVNVSGGVELTGDLGTLKLSINASGAASASCKVPRNGSLHTSADVLGAGGEVTVYGSLNITGKTFQPKISIPQGGNVTIDVGRYGNFTGGHLNLTRGGRVELHSRGNGTFFANLTFEWNSTLRIRVDSIASLRNRSIVLFNYSTLDAVYRSKFHGSVELFDDNQTLPLINPNNVQASRRLLADAGTVTWTSNGAYATSSAADSGTGTTTATPIGGNTDAPTGTPTNPATNAPSGSPSTTPTSPVSSSTGLKGANTASHATPTFFIIMLTIMARLL